MIQIERVADDVYVFTSDLYAQVTAGAVVSPHGTVLIDTMPFPSETKQIKHFLEHRLGTTVKYLILTHYHADHTYGTSFFPQAQIIAHQLCYDLLDSKGRKSLALTQAESAEFRSVELKLPNILFNQGHLNLHLGNKTLILTHAPGHSPDCVTVLLREDRVLFASDAVLPIPVLGDGDWRQVVQSLQHITTLELENIVQGHGEVILRGEIAKALELQIDYIHVIRKKLSDLIDKKRPRETLRKITLESIGRSRVYLGGLVEDLHWRNLELMYDDILASKPEAVDDAV